MTPTAVLAALHAAGLSARLSVPFIDQKLWVSPQELITPELRALVAAHRDELVTLLYGARADAEWPPVATDTPAQRWACSSAAAHSQELSLVCA